ncbi:MAG: nickel-responsive transcriptional regulator NikR [Acidobacteriota bacterium]|mgnify:CR=1 FL=1
MAKVARFGVSMEEELLRRFDALARERGYATRSEALRDLVRRDLVREEWADPGAEVAATVSLVYEHHEHHLADALTDLQHHHHGAVVSATHVHLDAHNCLEVVILRGPSAVIRRLADALLSTRGVKHGGVVATTTGKNVT